MMDKLTISKEMEKDLIELNTLENPCISYQLLMNAYENKKVPPDVAYFFRRYLTEFTPQQFALLLCGWYTVEQPFKTGDWVVDEGLNRVGKLEHYNEDTFIVEWCTGTESYYKHKSLLIRLATPEEIAQEKERRRWAEIGREVDQYKFGDIFKNGDMLHEVDSLDDPTYVYEGFESFGKDKIKLVVRVEQRFDLKEDT